MRKVSELATTFKGKLPTRVLDEPNDKTKPYLLMDGLRGGAHVYTEETELPTVTEQDSVLIGDGSKSGFAVRGVAGVLGSTLLAFRARAETHPSVLFHLLSSLFPFLNSATTGTAVPHLDLDLLLRLPLGIPESPEEQAAIARILDAVDTALERTRETVERAREFRQSLIHELLALGIEKRAQRRSAAGFIPENWDCEPLGELLAEGPTNGVYRPESDYAAHGTRIIRIDDFEDGRIKAIATLRRVVVEPVICDRYAVYPDDVLINRVNSLSHIGKATLVPPLQEPTIFESNMMRVRCGSRMLPSFLNIVLCSDIARKHWLARAKPAVNQASINQRDARELPVPVPSRDGEQGKIVAIVGAADKQIRALSEVMAAQQQLKRSLMHDLLTGRVRVQDASKVAES